MGQESGRGLPGSCVQGLTRLSSRGSCLKLAVLCQVHVVVGGIYFFPAIELMEDFFFFSLVKASKREALLL